MSAVLPATFERLPNPGATSGTSLAVQFNPSEYTLTKGAQLAEIPIPGLDQPIIQFVRGQTETLTLELFFDSTEGGTGAGATSVTTLTDQFYELIKIDPEAHAPPVLQFRWGIAFPGARERNVFKCVVASVRQQFTFFSPIGVPLRAKLTVELHEYKSLADQIRQLNLQSADVTKAHVVLEGETLPSIAYQEYGDPSVWRQIADANAIDDPLALAPGAILSVPRSMP
jgi:nucleoid-associated protein YgaU